MTAAASDVVRSAGGRAPGDTWAVVALKAPTHAKSRLAALLSAAQRRELLFRLSGRVLGALRETPGIDRVAVVTSSTEVAAFAGQYDAHIILQPDEEGTAAAFAAAAEMLAPLQPARLLMIAGDLPCISPAALVALLAAGHDLDLSKNRGVVLVPDRHRTGTNALLCTPPQLLAPCFGADSFRRHLRAAQAAGVPVVVCERDELTLDLDTVADVRELYRSDAATALAFADLLGSAEHDEPACTAMTG